MRYRHNAPELEQDLEIIDLSKVLRDVQEGKEVVEHERKPSKLSAYQQFCQLKRLEGFSIEEAARMWKEQKKEQEVQDAEEEPSHGKKKKRKLSAYNNFCSRKRLEGYSLAEAARMWREEKQCREE